jgi:hypothetical protein
MKCVGFGILLIGSGVFGVRTDAHAAGRLADVQIIDRDSGGVLPMYRSRGEYWVAGRPGARYSIMIQNHRGERILAVTAVDGINVISGETGAWSQSGYVFSPGESYEIAGWRKSNAEIAAFNFTAADNSYAERTGRPANIGVIGVALFLERPARIQWLDRLSSDRKSEGSGYAQNRVESAGVSDSRAAPPSFIGGAPVAPKLAEIEPYAAAPNPSPAQKLGTGHGARETSYVQDTTFDRLSSTPNELIKIRYDSYENLVAMGVVPTRPAWRPDPFPDSSLPRYVPDPPGG